MQLRYSGALGTILACISVVRSQTPGFNPFITPVPDQDIRAGQNFDITWQPANAPDGATISIKLLQGQSINALQDGPNVASNIPANAGRFTWAVPRSIQDNEVYSLKMTLDGDENTFQNSPFFEIDNLDNDDDNRPPIPAPNFNPPPDPAAPPPPPPPPANSPPPPPQNQGFNPNNPGRFRPDDDDDDDRFDNDRDDDDRFDNDRDDDDRFDNDRDDDDRFDNDFDDDDDRRNFPGFVPQAASSNAPAQDSNGVPKAAENPNNSKGNTSPTIPASAPDPKADVKTVPGGASAAGSKPNNGTSTIEMKSQASGGIPSNSKATGAASAGSPPNSKSTAPASSGNQPASAPKPLTDSGATSLAISSLFTLIVGITIMFAL